MRAERVKLTDAVVRSAVLPPDCSETVLWDSDVRGFGLRLRRAAKTYIVCFRPAGAGRSANMRRLRIGTPDTIRTASEARQIARTLIGKVAAGGDPAKDRAEEKRKERARVHTLLDDYEAHLARRAYVNRATVMSTLRRGLRSHRSKEIGEVRGADYAAIIRGLEAAGKIGAAEDFRARSRTFLAWCAFEAKVIDHNPLAGFRRGRATRSERLARKERERALTDEELARVWHAADPATVRGRYVRFLILTGCRRGEGAGLLREMVARDAARIDMPAAFTKQARGHAVYIAPQLGALLDACVHDARSDLVFPSGRTGGRMRGWTKLRAAIVRDSGVEFSLHDLRRTFRTGLSRLGIDRETAELALGHARTELESIYNHDDAEAKLRAAFEAWAAHVEAVARTAHAETAL